MKLIKILPILFLFICTQTFSQAPFVKGKIIDNKDQTTLVGASAVLLRVSDSTMYKGSNTNLNGNFVISNIAEGNYILKITFLGYRNYFKNISVPSTGLDLGNIKLKGKSMNLNAVNIQEKLPPVTQKEDTATFNAGAYKTNVDASAEDLVTKMPGITSQNGTVKAQGENVQQVLVDGKPFFGDDPNAVLKNIPAEIIDKIQVFDKKSDQAQFTGIDDENTTKTMNIITKPKFRNGTFGKVYGGYTDSDMYKLGGNLNIFHDTRRITILAQSNDINEQNFSSEDLLGVSSGGNRSFGNSGSRRPPRGGSPGGSAGGYTGGGSASNFLVSQQNGISKVHSFGLNYSDKWGKNIDVTASYFFNMSHNTQISDIFRQYVSPVDSGMNYTEKNTSITDNTNHRINLKLEYKMDTLNSILFQPKLSIQQNKSNSDVNGSNVLRDTLLNSSINDYSSNLKGYNLTAPILFRHKFYKKGRTFSWSITPGISQNQGPAFLNSTSDYYTDTLPPIIANQKSDLNKQTSSINSNITYTEPIDSNSLIQINYGDNYSLNSSAKETYNLTSATGIYDQRDTLLSNTFKSTYFAQNMGLTYRLQKKKLNFSLGLSYQNDQLKSDQQWPYMTKIFETFQSILPNANLRINFSQKKNLNISYRANNNPPSVDQLQNVLNNSNPLQLSIGNPDLKQDFQHNITLRYSATNAEKSSFFFVMLGANIIENYIGSSTYIASSNTLVDGINLLSGTQLKKPINLNGYYSLRSFIVYGIPINPIKCNLNLNLSGNYSRTPGLINNQLNYASAPTVGLGLNLSSNISPKIDFSIGTNSTLNYVENTLQKQLNSNYFNQSSQLKANWVIWKGFLLHSDVSHQYNTGLSASYNQNYLLWNGALAYKFLKTQNAEFRLSVFDILNQNKSITRNVSDTYIEDTQTNVLQRYVMLTFTFNIKSYISGGQPTDKPGRQD